jgi:hypothetical protein
VLIFNLLNNMLGKTTNHILDSSSSEDPELDNYKGIYFNDENDQKFYEGGAHFRYRDLCHILEKIVVTLSPGRRGKNMYEDYEEGNILLNRNY